MTDSARVVRRVEQFAGPVFRVLSDDLALPSGERVTRDYLRHLGSVVVVPYDEASGEVVMACQ